MEKLKKPFIEIFKGISIGIAFAIPGFSGGTMAVILGVYERLISGIGNIYRHPIKIIKELFFLLVGTVIGILGGFLGIAALLKYFPIPTVLFFVGLVIGSLPSIFNRAKRPGSKPQIKDVLTLIICFAIVILLPFIPGVKEAVNDVTPLTYLLLAVIGAICAGALIIPGVSGSLILMAFGYYAFVVGNLFEMIENLTSGDFQAFLGNFWIILSLGIGIVFGMILFSKIMTYLLKKSEKTVYFGILGFLAASPFAIIYAIYTDKDYKDIAIKTSAWQWIVGALVLLVGTSLTLFVELYKRKNEKIIESKEVNLKDESE